MNLPDAGLRPARCPVPMPPPSVESQPPLSKRKDSNPAAGGADEAVPVQAARIRARRRLIGAAVLVGIGIIGFPLVFETQPRPIAVDIPIEIPSKDSVPPLTQPPASAAASAVPEPPVAVASAPAVAAPSAPAAAALPAAVDRPAAADSRAAPAAARAPAPAPAEALSRDARRAQDLLEGKPVAAAAPQASDAAAADEPKAARFVVQAGAYTDPASLRQARQKVEKLGLKTYTQVIETEGGSRTRVRVGPFATRDEAERAAARIKSAGLQANILAL